MRSLEETEEGTCKKKKKCQGTEGKICFTIPDDKKVVF